MANWTNITDFNGMLTSANEGAPFWTLMLFMLWVVFLITFSAYGIMTAILAGGFLAMVIGLFLVYSGLVAWKWLLGIIATVIVAILIDIFFGKDT